MVIQRLDSAIQQIRSYNNNNNIIITLFESQIILAEHECCTNWGDCKSNKSNQIKSNQIRSVSIQWIVQLDSPVLIHCISIVIYLLNSAIQRLNN